tara:strand:+ start:910 stop:1143 length:234 start_codon:yes stop_codon:yes gene_type:complete
MLSGHMKDLKTAFMIGILAMIINALMTTLYEKYVDGYVNSRHLSLTSLLGFVSGFLAYISFIATGANTWITKAPITY